MRILFVTGRLAEPALRSLLADLAPSAGFDYEVAVLPISVAALMTPQWVARNLRPVEGCDRVMLPGHCQGDFSAIESLMGTPVELGPKDLRDLPGLFGRGRATREGYGDHNIEILAEINHAPKLPFEELLRAAEQFRSEGADVIDLGCIPGAPWTGVGAVVSELKRRGFRLSIDTFDPREVRETVDAGAELVLSVNASNREFAPAWGVEVVVVPDVPGTLAGLDATVEFLRERGVRFRVDPVLDPLGFGFAPSIGRYLHVRERYPDVPVMMGVGNITELTDVDSAGMNTLLIGFCQEAGIRSVLTTAVINWARSSVKEIDLARRLMHYAVTNRTLPKHLEPGLVALRDPGVPRFGPEILADMASRIKDRNWRIFAEDGLIIAMNGSHLISDRDPFVLFEKMDVVDASHAFYLGYEMMKARTALTLSKGYRQDQALDWGFLTEPEESHLARKKARHAGNEAVE